MERENVNIEQILLYELNIEWAIAMSYESEDKELTIEEEQRIVERIRNNQRRYDERY